MRVPRGYRPDYTPPLVTCPGCDEKFPAEDGPYCPYCEIDLREYEEDN